METRGRGTRLCSQTQTNAGAMHKKNWDDSEHKQGSVVGRVGRCLTNDGGERAERKATQKWSSL